MGREETQGSTTSRVSRGRWMEWEGGFDLKLKDGGHEAVGDRAGGEEASEDGRGVSRRGLERIENGITVILLP